MAGAGISLVLLVPVASAGVPDECGAPPVGFNVITGTNGADILVGTTGNDHNRWRGGVEGHNGGRRLCGDRAPVPGEDHDGGT